MNAHHILTPPVELPKRTIIFSIRLTPEEYKHIKTFARALNLPVSQVARHYLLQAIALAETEVAHGID